jgi:hypothetical protein
MEVSLYGIRDYSDPKPEQTLKKEQGSDKQFNTQLEFIELSYWGFATLGYDFSKIKKKTITYPANIEKRLFKVYFFEIFTRACSGF